MKEGPDISIVAALIGNPACANMLTALMAGPALTATELAQEAGLSLSTVSGHLDKLDRRLLHRGVRIFAELVRRLDPIPAAVLRAGVPQAVSLANDPQQEASGLLQWITQSVG